MIGVRSAAGPSRWYLNCPCCRLTIMPKVRSLAIRQCPRCLARTSTTVELFSSRLPADVLYARDSLPLRRRCTRPQAMDTSSMRNARTIAAAQRAPDVSRSGSGDTVIDQRRAAHLRIELRRACGLALASKRLTASPSRLAVDETSGLAPLDGRARECVPPAPPARGDSSRLQDTVPGRTRTHPPTDRAAR